MTRFAAAGPLRGTLRSPPDKSISHRAALVGAMAQETTRITGYLDAADTRATLAAVRELGAQVATRGPSRTHGGIDLEVTGVGLRGAGAAAGARERSEPSAIDVQNAGTLLRILPGWLAGQGAGSWVLDGDESIRRRPVDRVADPLRAMGATVECRDGRLPPLRVEGGSLRGRRHRLSVASAQVKSCLLLAGLLASDETQVTEPAPTRDHTERMLEAAGAEIEVSELRTVPVAGGAPERRIAVRAAERLAPAPVAVPGDFSSAAFWAVAAAIVPGSRVRIQGVGLNPTRVGLLGILNRMGAPFEVDEDPAAEIEPRGTISVRHGALAATRVHEGEVALAIDELPLVALLGCFAEGRTVVSGAAELRHKESDRIAAVVDGLRGLGAEIEAAPDGFSVRGTGGLAGGAFDSRGDHRLAMLGAVAGLASRDGVEVAGIEAAAVSYPGFEDDLTSLLAPPG
ncbi:MAG TPA: 3-phosphoshikimate 1-carboxyvinyltransferase [Solirubrobacterales bacterium]|nr:3-phosphoshikimate 1-carboxyvinyltransferase [Solirubrobacterales bacterium]